MPNLSRRKFIGGKVHGVGDDAVIDLRPPDTGQPWRSVVITSSHVVDPVTRVIFADATNNAISIAIPTAKGQSLPVTIRKVDATTNTVTVTAPSGQTIDGAASVVMANPYSFTIVSDGSNWRTWASQGAPVTLPPSGPPWDEFVRRDGTTTMLADWPVGNRHFSQVGVVAVQTTAPSPPVLGHAWLDVS